MTQPDELAAFIEARLAEAEKTAHHAGDGRIAWLTYHNDDGSMHHATVAADHDNDYWCADGRLLEPPASVLVLWDQATALSKPEMREEIRSLSRQSLRNRLHRKGIARLLNSRSESLSDRGGAYVETRGPRWLARHLAIWVVRNSGTRADWTTIRITSTAQQGRWHWRFHLAYRRIR